MSRSPCGRSRFGRWSRAAARLPANEDFVRVRMQVPAGAVSSGYFDLPRVTGFLYNSIVPVLQGLQGAADAELKQYGVALNMHRLPRTEVILRHLSPAMSYTVVKGNDIRMGYVSPCGSALMLGGIGALGALAGVADETQSVAVAEASEEMDLYRELERLTMERNKLLEQLKKERQLWAKRFEEIEKALAELERELEGAK